MKVQIPYNTIDGNNIEQLTVLDNALNAKELHANPRNYKGLWNTYDAQ